MRRITTEDKRGKLGPVNRPQLTALTLVFTAGLAVTASATLVLAQQPQPGGGSGPATTPAAGAPTEPGMARPGDGRPVVTAALEPYENRLIRTVTIKGLKTIDEQLVRNQLRSAEGRPLSIETVTSDVRRINRLGRFREINARIQPFSDQTVELIYDLSETPIIKKDGVQAVGNRQLSDQEIGAEINLLAGTPVDRFQLDRALRRIKDLYKKKGYYQADVTIDEKELEESGIVLFRIREGERLRLTDIRFEGNSIEPDRLRTQVKSKTWGLLDSGALDDVLVDQDVAALIGYYKDRGFLDVRIDREIRPSPDGREAIMTFLIQEGPVYILRSVRVDTDDGRGQPAGVPPTVLSVEQIAGLMQLKVGDVYAQEKVRKSVDAVADAYGKLGYVDARISRAELRDTDKPVVELLILVTEGRRFSTGLVLIKGNELSQQKVVRRQIDVVPDRPLDSTSLRESETRIRDANLFDRQNVRLTIQPEDPQNPGQRDVLAEVKETNTGSLAFGAAVNSDAGLIGSITLSQRNFDLYDTPDTVDELVRGRAFRGGGQEFNLSLQPGSDVQNYVVSISDNYLLESAYSGSIGGGYRVREYDEYTEKRLGGNASIGRRFGRVWSGALTIRGDLIEIGSLDANSIKDLRDVQGDSAISAVGARIRRTTLNSGIRPTGGTKLDLGVERVGMVGGDYEFTKIASNYSAYFTVNEDFLGRKTVFHVRNAIGYIPEGTGNAPIFERLYLGGRDFRGFKFRGVSPRGSTQVSVANPGDPGLTQDPRGGSWSFFLGGEIEQPILSDMVALVGFIDSGTVTDSPSLDDYRVSVGTGLRIYIPQLGPAPLAFDFGFAIKKQEGDKTRLFSFSLDIPF